MKEKYEKILQLFIQSIPDANYNDKYPHKKEIFTRERIAFKIKCIRVKYRKALDTGRQSGGGRVVATFYDLCSEIWSGSPATGSMEQGFESGNIAESARKDNSDLDSTCDQVDLAEQLADIANSSNGDLDSRRDTIIERERATSNRPRARPNRHEKK